MMPTARHRILIADADAQVKQHFINALTPYNLTFVDVDNGQDLEAALQNAQYDAVILGVDLPGLDYVQFLANLKSRKGIHHTDIILIHTPETTDKIAQYLEMGANDYLDIHLPPSMLFARMRSALLRSLLPPDEELEIGDTLELALDLKRFVLPFGRELSRADDLDQLIDAIAHGIQALCDADGVTILLMNDDNALEIVLMVNQSLNLRLGGTQGEPIEFDPIPLSNPKTGEPDHRTLVTHVANTKNIVHIPDVYADTQFDLRPTKLFDKRNNYHTRSMLTVPLTNKANEVIAVIQVINATDTSTGEAIPFKANDLIAADALGIQAAVAIDNYNLVHRQIQFAKFETDLEVGRRVQLSFLPDELPHVEGWDVAARFHPARQVAGDFFDIFQLKPNIFALVMADVTDKGVPAALYMALARSMLRAFSQQHYSLSWVGSLFEDEPNLESAAIPRTVRLNMMPLREGLKRANNYLVTNHADLAMFATTFFALLNIEDGLLMYVNCGHNPPMIVGPDGIREKLMPTAPVMGIMPDMPFKTKFIKLNEGETLMTFTDGVPESRAPDGEFFGDARLEAILEEKRISSAEDLLQRIEKALFAHIDDAAQFDDITMMAIRHAGGAPPTEETSSVADLVAGLK